MLKFQLVWLALLLCYPATNLKAQCDNCPSGNVDITTKPIDLLINGRKKTIQVTYLPDGDNCYIFPVFIVEKLEYSTPKGTAEIINESGNFIKYNQLHFSDEKILDSNSLVIDVLDVLNNNDYYEQVMSGLESLRVKGARKSIILPNTELSGSLNASIYHNAFKISHQSEIIRSGDRYPILIELPEKEYKKLEGWGMNVLQINISGSYNSNYSQKDYELTARFLKNVKFDFYNQVASQLGTEKILFMPAGGSANEFQSITNQLAQSIMIETKSFYGKAVDPEVLKAFVIQAYQNMVAKLNIDNVIDADTKAVFMLNNVIGLSASIGNVKKMNSSYKTSSDDEIKKHIVNKGAETNSSEGGGGLNVFGIFEINGNGKGSSSSSYETDNEFSLLKKFDQDLKNELQDGNINFSNGLNFASLKKMFSENSTEIIQRSLSSTKDKKKSFSYSGSLNTDINKTLLSNDAINKISFDLYSDCVEFQMVQCPPGTGIQNMSRCFPKTFNFLSDNFKSKFNDVAKSRSLFQDTRAVFGVWGSAPPNSFPSSSNLPILSLEFKNRTLMGNYRLYTYVMKFKDDFDRVPQMNNNGFIIFSQPTVYFNVEISPDGKVDGVYCSYPPH